MCSRETVQIGYFMRADLSTGAVLAGHRLDAIVGRGGMGVLYRATHIALDRTVALKVIVPALAADPAFRERFMDESRNAARIDHPNVIPIYHAGEEDGVLFITMRYVEGTDVRALLTSRGVLEPSLAAEIVSVTAAASFAAAASPKPAPEPTPTPRRSPPPSRRPSRRPSRHRSLRHPGYLQRRRGQRGRAGACRRRRPELPGAAVTAAPAASI